MIVKKQVIAACDRCGASVTSEESKPFPGWGELRARGPDLKVGEFGTGKTTYADLCPDCFLDFSEWWRREQVQQAVARIGTKRDAREAG